MPIKSRNCNEFYIEFDLYYLIRRFKRNSNAIEQFDLLYIGKSNSENTEYDILNRLECHKTVQRIIRDNNLYYRTREIMITIISFASKYSQQVDIENINAHIIFSDSKWEKMKLLGDISENKELILLIEAILINHFKPKYNEQYKERFTIENKVYQEFKRQNVNPVSIELDLSMISDLKKNLMVHAACLI